MEAIRQLEEEHKGFQKIIVSLIDNSKKNQLILESVRGNIDMLVKFLNK